MAAAASAAFLCCCERKYRGVKAGEGGERRKGRSAEEDGREWGWRGGRRENGTGEQRTKRTKERTEEETREKRKGRRQLSLSHWGCLPPTTFREQQRTFPRDWSGVKWVCTKGWLSTLLGLNSPRSRRGRELFSLLFTF